MYLVFSSRPLGGGSQCPPPPIRDACKTEQVFCELPLATIAVTVLHPPPISMWLTFPRCLGVSQHMFQVASQQGTYLARLFSRGFEFSASVPQKGSNSDDGGEAPGVSPAGGSSDPEGKDSKVPLSEKLGLSVVKGKFAKPFQFLNLGILAYTGAGGALAQVQVRLAGGCLARCFLVVARHGDADQARLERAVITTNLVLLTHRCRSLSVIIALDTTRGVEHLRDRAAAVFLVTRYLCFVWEAVERLSRRRRRRRFVVCVMISRSARSPSRPRGPRATSCGGAFTSANRQGLNYVSSVRSLCSNRENTTL